MDEFRAHQILQSPSQPSFVDPFRNFEEEANQQLGEPSSHTAPATASGTRDSLAALYRPPFVFMFQGTFEQVDDPTFLFSQIWNYLIIGHPVAICYKKNGSTFWLVSLKSLLPCSFLIH